MTIFKDGVEQEKVTLSDFDDTEKLHTLFEAKGFPKYSEAEMAERRKMKEAQPFPGDKNVMGPAAGKLTRDPNKLRRGEMKEKLRKLKEARKSFEAGVPRPQ